MITMETINVIGSMIFPKEFWYRLLHAISSCKKFPPACRVGY